MYVMCTSLGRVCERARRGGARGARAAAARAARARRPARAGPPPARTWVTTLYHLFFVVFR